jgi:hypothetical protein
MVLLLTLFMFFLLQLSSFFHLAATSQQQQSATNVTTTGDNRQQQATIIRNSRSEGNGNVIWKGSQHPAVNAKVQSTKCGSSPSQFCFHSLENTVLSFMVQAATQMEHLRQQIDVAAAKAVHVPRRQSPFYLLHITMIRIMMIDPLTWPTTSMGLWRFLTLHYDIPWHCPWNNCNE